MRHKMQNHQVNRILTLFILVIFFGFATGCQQGGSSGNDFLNSGDGALDSPAPDSGSFEEQDQGPSSTGVPNPAFNLNASAINLTEVDDHSLQIVINQDFIELQNLSLEDLEMEIIVEDEVIDTVDVLPENGPLYDNTIDSDSMEDDLKISIRVSSKITDESKEATVVYSWTMLKRSVGQSCLVNQDCYPPGGKPTAAVWLFCNQTCVCEMGSVNTASPTSIDQGLQKKSPKLTLCPRPTFVDESR